MKILPLFISLLIAFSCNESEQVLNENLNKTNISTEEIYLYEIDVLYVGTVTRINELKEQKQVFASKVARKDRTALKKLEKTQKEIEKLTAFKNYILELRRPKGPKPIKLPPTGCLHEFNCDPRRNLQDVKGIVTNKEFKTKRVLVKDIKGRVIAEGGKIDKDQYEQSYIQLEADFKGEAQLEITVVTKEFGEITTKTPVYKK